jgi:SAM-dependent methyltransferase
VLDIGAGNGYQSSIVCGWGCDVVSIDVSEWPSGSMFHPVTLYDGVNLPFSSSTFDVVFSSNVLEHVRNLPGLLAEVRRVLKPDGVAIHLMPSPTWRFWTSLTHYPYLILRVCGIRSNAPGSERPSSLREEISKRSIGLVLSRIFFAGRHGEYPNALAELYYFSRRRWRAVFRSAGFDVSAVFGNHLFYTGYSLLPNLSFEIRRRLAALFGSACSCFVTRMHTDDLERDVAVIKNQP